MQLSTTFSFSALAAIAASSALDRRQEEQYKLRVTSPGGDISGKYLTIRNSQIGLFPDSPPIVVSPVPSSTTPDRVSLHTVSIADVVRVVALNGTTGVYDLFNVDTPPEKDRSWEDWKIVEGEGEEKILTWAAAKRDSRSWLAMPVRRPETGQWVWFVDDFQGGFPGITMPIDDIVLENYP